MTVGDNCLTSQWNDEGKMSTGGIMDAMIFPRLSQNIEIIEKYPTGTWLQHINNRILESHSQR